MHEDLKKLSLKVEYIFLKKLFTMVKENRLSNTDASNAAKAFQAIEPFTSIEDCQQKMKQFVVQYPLYKEAADYSEAFHEELQTDKIVMQMKEHLNNNDIESALKIAQS